MIRVETEIECNFTLISNTDNIVELLKTIKKELNKHGNLVVLEIECSSENGLECYDNTEL